MIVRVCRVEDDGEEVFVRHSELRDCFPDDNHGYNHALQSIRAHGSTLVGGGAAPMYLLSQVGS